MANPILAQKADKSVATAIKAALKDGKFSSADLVQVIRSTFDGKAVSDLEYRDLKRFLRTERRLSGTDHRAINAFLQLCYPLEGPSSIPAMSICWKAQSRLATASAPRWCSIANRSARLRLGGKASG